MGNSVCVYCRRAPRLRRHDEEEWPLISNTLLFKGVFQPCWKRILGWTVQNNKSKVLWDSALKHQGFVKGRRGCRAAISVWLLGWLPPYTPRPHPRMPSLYDSRTTLIWRQSTNGTEVKSAVTWPETFILVKFCIVIRSKYISTTLPPKQILSGDSDPNTHTLILYTHAHLHRWRVRDHAHHSYLFVYTFHCTTVATHFPAIIGQKSSIPHSKRLIILFLTTIFFNIVLFFFFLGDRGVPSCLRWDSKMLTQQKKVGACVGNYIQNKPQSSLPDPKPRAPVSWGGNNRSNSRQVGHRHLFFFLLFFFSFFKHYSYFFFGNIQIPPNISGGRQNGRRKKKKKHPPQKKRKIILYEHRAEFQTDTKPRGTRDDCKYSMDWLGCANKLHVEN